MKNKKGLFAWQPNLLCVNELTGGQSCRSYSLFSAFLLAVGNALLRARFRRLLCFRFAAMATFGFLGLFAG